MSITEVRMIDVRGEQVEMIVATSPIDPRAKRVWINVNGVCLFRAYDCFITEIREEGKSNGTEEQEA